MKTEHTIFSQFNFNAMKQYKRISVISRSGGEQNLRHHLTQTEKKIILTLLNRDINYGTQIMKPALNPDSGSIKKKCFIIGNKTENTAILTIAEDVYSVISGKYETVIYHREIKFL